MSVADLGDDGFGAELVDAGVGARFDGGAKGARLASISRSRPEQGIEPIDLLQMDSQQEPMMIA